ncbi:DNA binding protein [Pseudomonas sichuanensis]|uniref:histone-like nucleoid-structuring protein, MvaT/MvaU family n=1 Tax=Pseudomonas sichuanensis TaxID=2213015 RepID=UPI002448F1F5|nr:histone-like nucleoid-structuring protein, MvaT/MvaU family [Pseudomonas sichuanensis]MDH0731291.1 DNA binding protein [Pseudomonas sichuanensis]MDH1583482.1 DNA binding protein [Pseudomonas sichuanensis]MDH1592780.1 DNA binding protein [Pseudomonas sichuanensis]MDH1598675.1 DNA binding protein [Pseudomonas sichuanensis]
MSRLAEFRHLEQQLAAQLAELEAMKNDEGLKREIAFEQKLRGLLAEYGVGLRQVIELLDPNAAVTRTSAETKQKQERKPRALKVYLNPHNGEVVETKGGNHKTLKLWKSEYGASNVESWLKS